MGMLKIIDPYRCKIEQDQSGSQENKDLMFGRMKALPRTCHRLIVLGKLEDTENTKQADNADGTEINTQRKIKRETGDQVDQSIEAEM